MFYRRLGMARLVPGAKVRSVFREKIFLDCVRGISASLLACQYMKILIEDAERLEYLTNTNLWTKNPIEGKCFSATGNALAAAKKESIGRFNIVGYISQSKQFVNLNHGRGRGIDAEKVLPANAS